MTAYIGHDNIIPDGTVTATSEASGYPKENGYDLILSDWWKASAAGTVYFTIDYGSAVSCDSWGIAGHDLPDNSGTIKPQYSSDNFSADTNDFDTVQTPATGDPFFRKVTSRSARYWRFEIVSTGAASLIGHLQLGIALALQRGIPVGLSLPRQARSNKTLNNVTDGGSFIGRSLVSEGIEFDIMQKQVTPAWIASNWDDLADAIQTKPFIFSWDYESSPLDASFVWLKNQMPKPKYSSETLIDFTIKVRGV